jgi:hypothetical protein
MKKGNVIGILVLVLAVATVLCFVIPFPVVSDPEDVVIQYILFTNYDDPSASYIWVPDTPEREATAQAILEHLAQSKVRRTRWLRWEWVPSLDYMSIGLAEKGASTIPRTRCLVLAPATGVPAQYPRSSNLSIYQSGKGLTDRFIYRLLDPDDIRTFVLDALGMPEEAT